MKRIANAALALLLSALLLLPTTVFALDDGDNVSWITYPGGPTTFTYAGEAKNDNILTMDMRRRVALSFTPEKTGFYIIKCEPTNASSCYSPGCFVSETFDGTSAAGNRANYSFSNNANSFFEIGPAFYFKKGEAVLIGISSIYDCSLSINWCFDVTSLTIGDLNDVYLIGESIWPYEMDNTEFVSLDADFSTTTNDGRRLYCEPVITGTVKSGTCILTATIGNLKKEFSVNCASIHDYIKSIEFPEGYAPTASTDSQSLDCWSVMWEPCPDYLTVTMTDGTIHKLEIGPYEYGTYISLSLPDNLTPYIHLDETSKADEQCNLVECTVVAICCGEVLAEQPCIIDSGENTDDHPSIFARISSFFSSLAAYIRAMLADFFHLFDGII